jgi:hypothetical protein
LDKKLGDGEVRGREYNPTSLLKDAIQVPASNDPRLQKKPQKKTIWEEQSNNSSSSEDKFIEVNKEPQLPLLPRPSTPEDQLPNLFSNLSIPEPPNCVRSPGDYGARESGVYGLDPKWYKSDLNKHLFMTPYGAKGIGITADFLQKHEHELSSPSRSEINNKFRKGAIIATTLGTVAREQLEEKNNQDP